MNDRHYTAADRLLMRLQRGLESLRARGGREERANPAQEADEKMLTDAERRHAAGLMRVNHAGEIAAQALYHGGAVTARDPQVREQLKQAAAEEQDHLDWCAERIAELGEQPSALAPLWYAGSFAIGATAGLLGDKWNLGFVAETEKQVVEHLEGHLGHLPAEDEKSRVIVEQMKADEARHGASAKDAGGAELPQPVKDAMKAVSKVMTKTAYWI